MLKNIIIILFHCQIILCLEDYYKILGVSRDADKQTIKKAFSELSKKYHPDKQKNNEDNDHYTNIINAYETLKDPEKKNEYDQKLLYGEHDYSDILFRAKQQRNYRPESYFYGKNGRFHYYYHENRQEFYDSHRNRFDIFETIFEAFSWFFQNIISVVKYLFQENNSKFFYFIGVFYGILSCFILILFVFINIFLKGILEARRELKMKN